MERVTRKNKNNESTLPLTISAQDGLVDQNTYFNKQVASKDMSNYYLLKKSDFAYNKSYSNGFPLGTVKRLDKYDEGTLSSLYIVFRPKKVNSDFLSIYYDTNKWHREVMKLSAEGARNHGLLNIPVNSFFEKKIIIPILEEEQLKIAKFLKRLEKIITLHQRKINTLEAQKKAYLNVMFPKNKQTKPNLRFNRYIDEWEQRKLKELAVIDTGKAFKSEYFHKEGAYLVVTNKNIRDQKHIIVSQGDRIDITESTVLNRYLLSGENILITMDGVHIGKSGRYSDDNSVLAQRVARIRSENISFVDQVIQRNSFLRKMNKLSVGNAIKHISLKNISDYSLMAPTESEEKNNIGNFLEKLDIILSLYHSKLSILKQLKQVYLNKMFI